MLEILVKHRKLASEFLVMIWSCQLDQQVYLTSEADLLGQFSI